MEVAQAGLQVFRLLCILDGEVEEVDEPGQGVLVHGLDVGQVSDGEEENGAVHCNLGVAHAGLVNLFLGLLSDGLLLRDLIGQFLGGGQHFDGSLILQNVTF